MSDDASVSQWLEGLRAGDDEDIRRLWDRYFQKLVGLARARLPARSRREHDEEDVALSAFHSLCERAGRGQFPRLADRDDLWRLLSTITARKVLASERHRNRLKRGGGRHLADAGAGAGAGPERNGAEPADLTLILSREPNPEDAAEFAEEYDRLFAKLESPALKDIALRKLEGRSSVEIAEELRISSRTVDRKLELIRALWDDEKT